MEEFYGKHYVMVKSEHFDELLVYLGISYIRRQVAKTLRPVQFVVHHDDDTFSLHFQCTLVKYHLDFRLGEEFDEMKPDGTMVRAFITIEGNKIFHRQVDAKGRTLNHVYEFFPEKLTLTTTSPGMKVTVKRHYVAVI